jgi:hypothetical protein
MLTWHSGGCGVCTRKLGFYGVVSSLERFGGMPSCICRSTWIRCWLLSDLP